MNQSELTLTLALVLSYLWLPSFRRRELASHAQAVRKSSSGCANEEVLARPFENASSSSSIIDGGTCWVMAQRCGATCVVLLSSNGASAGDREQGLGGSLEQQIVDHRLVGVGNIANRSGQGEDEVEIGRGQESASRSSIHVRAAAAWHFGQCRLLQLMGVAH